MIVAQNLVAARYVQLTPAYRKGGGPTMRDGAVIPSDRTAVPVEWDEVKTQLMRLATELGPKTGVSGTSVSRFIDSAANALDGNGDKLRQTLAQLSGAARIFAEGSGNIVDIIKNLQIFVTALRDSKEQIVMFQNRLASLTSVVNDSRSDLDAALSDLSVALGEVQRFVAGSRNQTSEQIRSLAERHPEPGRQPHGSRERPSYHAERDRQLREHLLPGRPVRVTGAFSLSNFANPVYFFCGLIGAVENTTAPETAKLCAQYLGPALRLLNFNNLPFPTNLYLRPAPSTRNTCIYTDPKLAPGGAGPGDAPEPQPTVSAYTGMGDVPPPAGLGTATWPARTVWTGRGACDPIACVVPRRTDTRAAHHHPGFVADDERRRHAAPAKLAAPAAPPPPPGPPLPAEAGAAVMIRAAHAWGYRPPEGQGESRIHLSRVKRLAVVGACLALALTGCSFQGLNSLPLPGAVGRGPDAVTYHVEVAECRDAGVEFAGHDQ